MGLDIKGKILLELYNDDLRDHWDELTLSMEVDGSIAQESKVSSIIHPERL